MANVALSVLVELRNSKDVEIKILQKQIKLKRKEKRELTKQIDVNLNSMILSGSNEKISVNNFGYILSDSQLENVKK